MSNLLTRIVSAIVLAAVVLVVTWYGGWAFRLLSAAMCVAIFHEWATMAAVREPPAWAEGGLGILPIVAVLVFAAALLAGAPALLLIALAAAGTLLLGALSLWRGRSRWLAAGMAYATLSGLTLAMLRDGDRAGLLAILFLFAVVWATDILAYFVGRAVGGPKLAPAISPGKTWSGAIGGTVAGLAGGVLVAFATGSGVALLAAAALVLSIVSQMGDLLESWVKRRHGVKDSGWIIPGHGGVMDRVDGLVAAALALYLFGVLAGGGLDAPAHGLFPG